MDLAQLSLPSRESEQEIETNSLKKLARFFEVGGEKERETEIETNQFGEGRLENGDRSQSSSRTTEKHFGRTKTASLPHYARCP